jgi:type IV pilus assembly protein PilM
LKKGSKTIVLDSILVPTPVNSIKDGVLTNKEEIAAVINNALLIDKIKEKNVVFTISSSKIITREVELPYLKPNKLKNIIRLNAEEYFPVNLTEYSLDYTIIDVIESEEGKKAKVIVFAAHIGLVNMYVELANLCKLKILSVDYSGNSIVSYVQNEKLEGTNLFLDIGAESTMVTIISNNVVKFSRNLLLGTKTMNESIMNHFEVDYEEATKISKERQLLSYDNKENTYLSNDVSSGMEQLLSGVSRLVDYYSSRNKNAVEKVYILGGGSEIYGISEYVEQFFDLKTEKMINLKNVVYTNETPNVKTQLYFAATIGATLASINLLPADIKNREAMNARKRLPFLLLILLLAILAGVFYAKTSELDKFKDQKATVESEIESMQDINEIKNEYSRMLEKEAFRRNLNALSTTKSDYILDLIVGLEKTMPTNSFISSLADTEDTLTLEYTVQDEATLGQLLTYLKSIEGGEIDSIKYPLFSDIYTSGLVRTGNPGESLSYVTASIVCSYFKAEVEVDDK